MCKGPGEAEARQGQGAGAQSARGSAKQQEPAGFTGPSQAGCVHPKSKQEPWQVLSGAWCGQIGPSSRCPGSRGSSDLSPTPRLGLPSIPGGTVGNKANQATSAEGVWTL